MAPAVSHARFVANTGAIETVTIRNRLCRSLWQERPHGCCYGVGVQVERDTYHSDRHVHSGIELPREPALGEHAESRARARVAWREVRIDQAYHSMRA